MTDACAKAGVVETAEQALVEGDEPRQRCVVEHRRRIGDARERPRRRPRAQQRLHRDVERLAVRQLVAQRREHRQVGEAALEEELGEDAPVVGVVPEHLDRQHLGVAEDRVLAGVKRERALVERMEELVEDARVRIDRPTGAVAPDQLADVGVGDGDEVAAR
jgi:hypothetical protein